MARDTFTYTIQARCTPATASALLADLSRQAELHPLVVRVVPRPPRPGASASYTITDRVALGPLHFSISYQADVLRATGDEVVTVARQWSGTRVRNHARLRVESPGLTRVDVEVTLTAPAPLFGYAFRQARAAHLTLAARLGPALGA